LSEPFHLLLQVGEFLAKPFLLREAPGDTPIKLLEAVALLLSLMQLPLCLLDGFLRLLPLLLESLLHIHTLLLHPLEAIFQQRVLLF